MIKLRLLLVDDHQLLRAGLRTLIDRQEDMEVVGESSSAGEGILLAFKTRPDVILLDLTLPGGGMTLLQQIQKQDSPPRVLILTMHDDPAYARAALSAGATGYIVKTVSEAELLAAVRTIARGKVFVDLDNESRTAQVFGTSVALNQQGNQPKIAKLSEREQEILKLLGQGHTNQAISEQLDLSPKTVATYRARIAEKLGLKTIAEFVKYAADNGL